MSAEERQQARRAASARRASACAATATYDVSADARWLPARRRAPVIEAGKTALMQGVARDRVAVEFGVARRTVDRWAADQHRAAAPASTSTATGGGR